ncbi:o-succinylbenzoate--CoA ligase [Candidatus Binatia bacterium]|nr:o-succinylbenzoate--CoA ligase [Candidatus Binatia bacterium]
MTIGTPSWLERAAVLRPSHVALLAGDRRVTFADAAEAVRQRAGQLVRLGVRPGDHVGILLPVGIDFVTILHAVTRVGAVAVPLGPRATATEVATQLAAARCAWLCYDARGAGADVVTAAPVPAVGVTEGRPGDPVLDRLDPEPDLPDSGVDPGAAHGIVFTSGSSGTPRGAVLTAGNHYWNASASALLLGVRADDRWLACLPLHHVGGLAILMRSVLAATTVVLHDRFDAERVNRAIDTEGVTMVSVVANMLHRMLEARGPRPYPPSLRCVLVGGGPVPEALLVRAIEHGVPAAPTYGLTEAASQVATLLPALLPVKRGSVGLPLLPTQVRIVVGERTALPEEVGEIRLTGPTLTPGYVNAALDLDESGWLRTRDLGWCDSNGFLHIVGRADDTIVSGGENVHPREVESALESHPAVAEACVFGMPDAEWGERITAWVQPRAGAVVTAAELTAHVRQRIAGFKVPRRIRVVADLPRSPAGKPLRREARRTESAS